MGSTIENINLTVENLPKEHICCALSSLSTIKGVEAKKYWLKERIGEGLVFRKLDARAKVFIEYIPAEYAWVPLVAKGYMVINCFWVSGSYKGQGYGKKLLEECMQDAKQKGYKGLVVIVGDKKKPFLTDKAFMIHNGFEVVDTCKPYFELLSKSFEAVDKHDLPRFKDSARSGMGEGIKGIDIFYTAQCPFTIPYTEMLSPVMQSSDYPVMLHQIETMEMAQEHICPITTYSVFVDGRFITQEILTPAKLTKLIEKYRA